MPAAAALALALALALAAPALAPGPAAAVEGPPAGGAVEGPAAGAPPAGGVLRARPGEATARWRVLLGGLHVADAEAALPRPAPGAPEGAPYALRMRARLAGLSARLFALEFDARASGALGPPGGPAPRAELMRIRSRWAGGRVRSRGLRRGGPDGADGAALELLGDARDPEDAAPGAVASASDPLSLLASFFRDASDWEGAGDPLADGPGAEAARARACGAGGLLYDGRRLLEAVPAGRSVEEVDLGRFSPHGGRVLSCRFELRPAAGFERGDARRAPESLEALLRPVPGAGLVLPVRIAFRTPLGRLLAYLESTGP